MTPRPTQSVPGGFLLVFFGLVALGFAGLAGYAGWLAYHSDYLAEAEKARVVWKLGALSAVGLLAAAGLFFWGLRMAFRVGAYDVHDPKEPKLKW